MVLDQFTGVGGELLFCTQTREIAKSCHMRRVSCDNAAMGDLAILFIRLVVTAARLFGPGGARVHRSESLLLKHQRLILNRSRVRAPIFRSSDR